MIFSELKKQFQQPDNSVIKLLWINSLVFFSIRIIAVLLELFYLPKVQHAGEVFLTPYIQLDDNLLGLLYHPWTLLTTIFSHWDFMHLALNMLMLYFVGQMFSTEFGDRRLLGLYIVGGLGANVFYLIVQNVLPYYIEDHSVILGASGAVTSLLIGLATVFPNREVSLFLLLRIKFVWLAVITVGLSVISVTGNNGGGEVCHLGGALIGFIFGKLYQNGTDITKPVSSLLSFFEKLIKPQPKIKVSYSSYRQEKTNTSKSNYPPQQPQKNAVTQQMIDAILDKLKVSGYTSLSKEEKRMLFEYSKQ